MNLSNKSKFLLGVIHLSRLRRGLLYFFRSSTITLSFIMQDEFVKQIKIHVRGHSFKLFTKRAKQRGQDGRFANGFGLEEGSSGDQLWMPIVLEGRRVADPNWMVLMEEQRGGGVLELLTFLQM